MSTNQESPKKTFLSKLTTFFFDRPRATAIIWLALAVFGIVSYTTLLRREGFPSINIPFAIVSGAHFVNDPAKVDAEVSKPISDLALEQEEVTGVQTQSQGNFFAVSIQYKEGTDAKKAAEALEQKVKDSGKLPASATAQFNVPYFGVTGGDVEPVDLAISFFDEDQNTSTADAVAKAEEAATWLRDKNLSDVEKVFVKVPFEQVKDPVTGQAMTVQRSFDRFGFRESDTTKYFNSVIIGIQKKSNADVIELDEQVQSALDELNGQSQFEGFQADISASFAPSIHENLSELQRVLLEGLLAVLIVGSIVIAIRASLITVVSMVTVLVATLGFLYLIGYTLNVITLFALILSLALIVDDTIIMVEAIDAARKRKSDPREAVTEATHKISRAMVAATATACLSFAPLLFVGGILGSFIFAIPITIISALIISLLVALIFIPFFARFVLLGKKQMGGHGVKEVAARFEEHIADFITKPMRWAQGSQKRLFPVGIAALIIGFGFTAAGIYIAKDVVFNIFPPTKDTNGLIMTVNFPPGTSIEQAEKIAEDVDNVVAEVTGENFVKGAYFNSGSAQTATEQIEIISYNDREITSPEIVEDLQERFDTEFKEAQVAVGQLDVGPPSASFVAQIDADNREAAFKAANDLATYMREVELKRLNGKVARFVNVSVSSTDQYVRSKGELIVTVSAGFDGNDTTTLVTLAQDSVKEEFTAEKLQSYGLAGEALKFDLGFESENQDSFRTLVLAFPVLLVVMYVLLAFQFRSFLQPLLIFMAIPFSIFGVMAGLRITDNAISFFAMLGFFALIGLSIKNTILLTDYANQARRSGMGIIGSAQEALKERFRPLFATSLTAVVSLIPLAIASPFWQGLAVVLIFGLVSSTFLVVTVFPYYYLGAEYLRRHIKPKNFFIWLLVTAVLVAALTALTSITYGLLMVPVSLLVVIVRAIMKRSRPVEAK